MAWNGISESPILACAARWRPSVGWADAIRPAWEALEAGAVGLAACDAWSTLATMAGDTGGAPIALAMCLHAERALPDGVEHRGVAAHRDLCLLDLGLAEPASAGPIRIAALGEPGIVTGERSKLEVWLAGALLPFEGDLARAALYCRRLAATRVGLIAGPPPQP
jgi:hypothetical protein